MMSLKDAKIGEEYLTKSKGRATLRSVIDGKYIFAAEVGGIKFECLESGRSKSGTGEYDIIDKLVKGEKNIRSYNVGKSDYSKHKIQPWDIWLEYGLNPWDADIVKRVLRNKEGERRKLDYQKIIHICQERIRQLDFS